MAYKPLKKRYMTQEYDGPLSKMINKAVEERVSSVLKNVTENEGEDEMEMSDWEKVSSNTSELDMSNDPRYSGGTTTTDVYSRQGESDPYEGEKVDSDTWKSQYEEAMEGGGSKGMQEYVKKYNMDGTAKTEYKEETTTDLTPAELEKIQKREIDQVPPVEQTQEQEMGYAQANMGSNNLASIMGMDPNQAGALSTHAKEFFYMEFSSDNPSFDVLKDEKQMKKWRKEYNKSHHAKKKPGRYGNSMPFERWVMQSKGLLNDARQWEGDNPKDEDNSQFQNPDGSDFYNRDVEDAKQTRGGRNDKSGNWYDKKAEVEGGGGAPRFNESSHMPSRKTMSFRKPQPNTGGFKMKRHAK